MDYAPEPRVVGGRRRGGASCGGAMTGGVSSVLRSPAVHEAKMELAQRRAMEGYGATPAQRHRANQKATHKHMMGGASTGGAMTGGFSAMDLIFPAHSLFGMGANTGGAMTGGAMTGGASTGGMLYHGAPHPTMKGVHWHEHPLAVGGGFWSNLWDGVKNVGSKIYDNVLTPIGHLARKAVPVVGNLIGAEFGVPIAGTLADQGLKAVGLGRRRGKVNRPMYPHGMEHPHHKGIHFVHHPHAIGGGFWSDAWDKIKQGASWVGDKVNQGVNWVGEHAGELARKAVEPVGNFIGKEFGIDNAGTMANQGLSMVGLGRRRRRGGAMTGGMSNAEVQAQREASFARMSPERQASYNADMERHGIRGIHPKGGAMCGSGELTITHGGASTGGVYGQVRRGGASTGGSFGKIKVPTAEQSAQADKFNALSDAEKYKITMDRALHKLTGRGASTGGARSARGAVVSRVMRERGCSLPEASRIVKAEGLY